MQHTPLPWRVAQNDEEAAWWWGVKSDIPVACVIVGEDRAVAATNDDGLATEQEMANARLIVTAVNYHAQLVAALDALIAAVVDAGSDPEGQVSFREARLALDGRRLLEEIQQ